MDIWEERKVFGSMAQNLKNVILGVEAPPPLEFNKKRSRTGSVRIVKKDSRSIRTVRLRIFMAPPSPIFCWNIFMLLISVKLISISSCMDHCCTFYGIQKLTIGGPAEKIVSAFHAVLSEHPNEDAEMSKCKSSVHRVRKMEKDVDIACNIGKLSTYQS